MNLNKCMFIGRVTKTPEIRSTPAGQSVTTFGLAVNRTWTDKDGGKKESVEFINIVFWGKSAEIITQYVVKGQLIFVEGRMTTREWEKNGEKHRTTEIVGERFQFGPKATNSAPARESMGPRVPASTTGQIPTNSNGLPEINIDKNEIKPEDLPF